MGGTWGALHPTSSESLLVTGGSRFRVARGSDLQRDSGSVKLAHDPTTQRAFSLQLSGLDGIEETSEHGGSIARVSGRRHMVTVGVEAAQGEPQRRQLR